MDNTQNYKEYQLPSPSPPKKESFSPTDKKEISSKEIIKPPSSYKSGLRRGLTRTVTLQTPFMEALNNRPKSSKNQIIFPFDKKTKTYSRSEFSSKLCDNRLKDSDIDKVFAELRNDTKTSPGITMAAMWSVFLFFLFLGALVATVVLFFLDNGYLILTLAAGVMIFILFVFLTCCLMEMCNARTRRQRDNINAALENWNNGFFKNKKIVWKKGKLAAWIQADILPLNNNENGGNGDK